MRSSFPYVFRDRAIDVVCRWEVKLFSKYVESPIVWYGGKRAIREFIFSIMPYVISRYVEVFGGGAAILLGKEQSKFEVYNDFNSDLVNLFRCIKERPLAFLQEVSCFPLNSRQEFKLLLEFMSGVEPDFTEYRRQEEQIAREYFNEAELAQTLKMINGRAQLYDVKRAAAFYKLIRYSYGGGGRSFGGQPVNLINTIENIYAVSNRLKNVVIENKDFESLIKTHDREDTFFYLDPPYVNTESYYQVEFKKEDHIRLYDTLKTTAGKWLLSYNDCAYIKDLYQDYCIIELSRPNSLAQKYQAGSEFKELLIANYDVNERAKHGIVQLSIFEEELYGRNYLQDYRNKR